eukprot:CAMPEP_0185192400 /NCGR_PEP_ID=MMETSP1140-20130426/18356_1 /TAXON_ID=298111 /ORGANISM="Pavlova sp., Strain CCMP459" /LENGTH=279 /DNA_ID=CAMNT_0027759145 /DNA_START=38 /DNA_END=879 /DNA_ORIENTATION=+
MGVVITGTIMFYAAGFLAMLVSYTMPSNKDKGLTATLIVLATVCTWLLWVITFMMQVNPLIYPIMPVDEALMNEKSRSGSCAISSSGREPFSAGLALPAGLGDFVALAAGCWPSYVHAAYLRAVSGTALSLWSRAVWMEGTPRSVSFVRGAAQALLHEGGSGRRAHSAHALALLWSADLMCRGQRDMGSCRAREAVLLAKLAVYAWLVCHPFRLSSKQHEHPTSESSLVGSPAHVPRLCGMCTRDSAHRGGRAASDQPLPGTRNFESPTAREPRKLLAA